jgi:hypothetical protein
MESLLGMLPRGFVFVLVANRLIIWSQRKKQVEHSVKMIGFIDLVKQAEPSTTKWRELTNRSRHVAAGRCR